jgi:hypothetical protein
MLLALNWVWACTLAHNAMLVKNMIEFGWLSIMISPQEGMDVMEIL